MAWEIHPRRIRGKDSVHSNLRCLCAVAFEIPGIAVEVFAGTELGGIHEHGRHEDIAEVPGYLHESEVSGVEGTHGGNESDPSAFPAPFVGGTLHGTNISEESRHGLETPGTIR
jgi:hypothetical protein